MQPDPRDYEIRIWYSAEKGDECFVAQVVEWPRHHGARRQARGSGPPDSTRTGRCFGSRRAKQKSLPAGSPAQFREQITSTYIARQA